MYKLTETIKNVIQECIDTGNNNWVSLNDSFNTRIMAEWEEVDQDDSYDVVVVYITQDFKDMISFVVEETKTLNK